MHAITWCDKIKNTQRYGINDQCRARYYRFRCLQIEHADVDVDTYQSVCYGSIVNLTKTIGKDETNIVFEKTLRHPRLKLSLLIVRAKHISIALCTFSLTFLLSYRYRY